MTKNIKSFKQKAQKLLDALENLIETMPQKGDTESTCQRVTLQRALNELQYAFNGTE